jgi:C2H2-type zinc finger protein
MSANPRSLKRTSRGSKMVEYRCDLCKRNFTHAHALQMHIETSGAHAKSRQPATTNYQARTAPKTQAAGQVVSSGSIVMPPNRHELANQQNSTRHDNVRKRGIMEDLPYHSQRAPYQGPAAFNRNYSRERMQPWCSVCDREFYTEMGFQRHINTSREHKENLEKDSSRESSVQSNSSQYRPEVTVASMLSKPEMHGSGHQQATANMTFTQMQVPAIGVEGDTFGMPNLMSWNSSAWQIDFVPPSMTYMAHESRPQPARSVPNISYPHGQPWSDVPFPIHPWVLELLWMNCHTLERLSHSGYRLRQETEKEIDRFRKCRNCGGWAVTCS